MSAPDGVLQLSDGFGLDLPDPLSSDLEDAAQGTAGHQVTQPQDLPIKAPHVGDYQLAVCPPTSNGLLRVVLGTGQELWITR